MILNSKLINQNNSHIQAEDIESSTDPTNALKVDVGKSKVTTFSDKTKPDNPNFTFSRMIQW